MVLVDPEIQTYSSDSSQEYYKKKEVKKTKSRKLSKIKKAKRL